MWRLHEGSKTFHNYQVNCLEKCRYGKMLRVLKRKAQEDGVKRPTSHTSVAGSERQSSPWTASSDTPSSSADTPVVSHIPVSVASSGMVSTNSSISSSHYHPFQQNSEEETYDGDSPMSTTRLLNGDEEEDSTNESPPAAPGQASAASHQDALKRRISIDSGEELEAELREIKRPRLTSMISSETFTCQAEDSPGSKAGTRLLATPKDDALLTPLHVFVRRQIEVFEATADDLKQPSPGRRIPIKLNQVGLRCIHCKDLPHKQRKKRAVCYPSSVGRVYNSVSDMKWSHIPICSGLPDDLRAQYEALKEKTNSVPEKESAKKPHGSSGTASTSKFYRDSALELGLEDRDGGIYLSTSAVDRQEPSVLASPAGCSDISTRQDTLSGMLLQKLLPPVPPKAQTLAAPQSVSPSLAMPIVTKNKSASSKDRLLKESKNFSLWAKQPRQTALLACEEDKQYLAPIHCFVRRHVEVFTADEGDLGQSMAGRKKRVVLGQAGLRCIWCKNLQAKDRVKRAICYPPSVSGIYHAISNIKHDHFAKCKGLPKDAREEFSKLKSSSMRGGSSPSSQAKPTGALSRRIPNSTAQYYHDSALRMGLIDSDDGIRFDPKRNSAQRESACIPCNTAGERTLLDVPDGMAALMIAATDPEVRAKYEQRLKGDNSIHV